MTDTGTSDLYIPSDYYKSVVDVIGESVSLSGNKRYGYTFPCSELQYAPTIRFLYGGYWMEMLPVDYALPIEGYTESCLLRMWEETDDPTMWLLGDPFLRGYYSTHDHDNNAFGFVPHATSSKVAVV